MLYAMGPAQNHEAEEAMDNTSSDPLSQRGNVSGCNSPEVDRNCRQSPHSSYNQRDQESDHQNTDAWMGYTGVWPRQHNLYTSQHSQQHHLSMQQQPPPQHRRQLSSRSSSWEDTTTISSTVESPTLYKKEHLNQESTDDYTQPSSSNQCEQPSRHQATPRRMLSSQTSTGLVDLRNLTTPVDMVSGSDCIPLSEKCMRYSLSIAPPTSPRQGTMRSSLLKRKPSLGKSESISSSSQMQTDEARAEKRRRFTRTTEALQKLGLWDVAIRTGKMIVQNRELQKEIDQLRQDSKQLMLSVLKNPENDNLKRALITMQARINAQKHQIFQNHNMSAVKS